VQTKIERLHAAYLEAKIDPDAGIARVLRGLAKRHGVPFSEADRAASVDGWEIERRGRKALAWHRQCARGAETEEDFVRLYVQETYAHLVANGPEGVKLAAAFARDVWRRAMGPALEWRAAVELDEARAEYDAIEAARKKIAEQRQAARTAEARS
jgi:hypothetical protein